MQDVLALILGGGRGTRLFPLTELRSKPAVPIGGKYRLIDVPISNCLHGDLRQIFVLTQFNSASLNRHVSSAYRMDLFSRGFVEILAAEQTPESTAWFQGTADAVRKAVRHITPYEAGHYLILAGDHLYRMDYRALIQAHLERGADITIAAQPVDADAATEMGIFRFDRHGDIAGFEEKPTRARLAAIGTSQADGSAFTTVDGERPFVASMGIYLFTRNVLLELLERELGVDFGHELIPAALGRHRVAAYLHYDYWADVGTIESFYDANIKLTAPDAPFRFYDPRHPIYTHARFLPPAEIIDCHLVHTLIAEGARLSRSRIEDSVIGIRTVVGDGARIRRSVLLGADVYENGQGPARGPGEPPLGIGSDVELDRVIVDKNARIGRGARLINTAGVAHADGDGYFIRSGIIIVPKDGAIREGLVV